ncbi:acid protease [Boletus edulis]|nr:acid protease [Boletus edulis]
MLRSFLTSSSFILAFCLGTLASTSLPGLQVGQPVSNADTSPSNSDGISPVSLADDGTYYTVIQAGQISFRVSIDTGSSDLWLVSTGCTTKPCAAVPKYPLSYASPTFVSVNNNETGFNLSYADGTRESIEVSNVTVPSQAFGVVTNSNVTLIDDVSGILGLGFPRLSEIYVAAPNGACFMCGPFFASLSQQGILDYPIFGLSLTRNSIGSLALGAIDASVVQNTSNIVWNEVVPFAPVGTQTNTSGYMFWAYLYDGLCGVNGSVLTPMPTYPGQTGNSSIALLDVGTPGLYGPYQDVKRLYALFPDSRLVDESGQWAIPCSSSATLTFSFGNGTAFVLQPTDYIIGPVAGNPGLCLSWPKASPPSADGIDWQLGTPFLRTVYSVWSFGIDYVQPPMIGLYAITNSSAPVEPPALVSSYFASVSATLATALPNYPLPTPTFTTPPYVFNTSVPAALGEIVDSELATSTYPPLVASPAIGATGLPQVSDRYTLIATKADGELVTSIYHLTEPSVALGEPPGWSGAGTLRAPVTALGISLFAAVWAGVQLF